MNCVVWEPVVYVKCSPSSLTNSRYHHHHLFRSNSNKNRVIKYVKTQNRSVRLAWEMTADLSLKKNKSFCKCVETYKRSQCYKLKIQNTLRNLAQSVLCLYELPIFDNRWPTLPVECLRIGTFSR